MVLNPDGCAAAFALAALDWKWNLKLRAPLKTPLYTHKEYLPAIFTGVLRVLTARCGARCGVSPARTTYAHTNTSC